MKLAIHQPCYIPYLGIFYKMYQSDEFVILDDAQFSKGYVFNWNTIKTPQGTCRLKIPVEYKFGDALNEVVPRNYLGWKDKHMKTIYMNYHKAKYFDDFYYEMRNLIYSPFDSLASLNTALFLLIASKFGILKQYCKSSSMNITSAKEQRVIDICKRCGADVYISGHGASAYQDEEHFASEGIKLQYTDYKPIEYPQLWGDFAENMSVIDYIFNQGFDWDGVLNRLKGQG